MQYTCFDCLKEVGDLYRNPRRSLLANPFRLCAECAHIAYDEVISDAENLIENSYRAQESIAMGDD